MKKYTGFGFLDEDDGFDYDSVMDSYKTAIDALKLINQKELNNQRPGGGYSDAAKISYAALKQLGEI